MKSKTPQLRGAVESFGIATPDYPPHNGIQADSDHDIAEHSRLFAELLRTHPHWLQKPDTRKMVVRMYTRIITAESWRCE